MNYIRYQESETFELQDSYIVEISTVGEYRIKQPAEIEHIISPEDFHRRHELEVSTCINFSQAQSFEVYHDIYTH